MSPRLRFLSSGLLFVSSLLILNPVSAQGQAQPRVVEAVDNARRVTLPGNVHPLARAEFDRGAASESLPMTRILLLLKRSDEQKAALQDYLEKQQDKSSPNYHQWLTPQEFGAQYGPADADIQSVTQWLSGQGFTVEKVYSGKTVIEFSGSAAQVRAAFGTEIRNYQVEGKIYSANANDPQIPAALAPVVAGVVSLNSFPRQSHVRVAGMRGRVRATGLAAAVHISHEQRAFLRMARGISRTLQFKSLIAPGTMERADHRDRGRDEDQCARCDRFPQHFRTACQFYCLPHSAEWRRPGNYVHRRRVRGGLGRAVVGGHSARRSRGIGGVRVTPASQGVDLSALYIIEHNLAGVMSESYGNCEADWEVQGTLSSIHSGNRLRRKESRRSFPRAMAVRPGATTSIRQRGDPWAGGQRAGVHAVQHFGRGNGFQPVNQWSTYWSTTNNDWKRCDWLVGAEVHSRNPMEQNVPSWG